MRKACIHNLIKTSVFDLCSSYITSIFVYSDNNHAVVWTSDYNSGIITRRPCRSWLERSVVVHFQLLLGMENEDARCFFRFEREMTVGA